MRAIVIACTAGLFLVNAIAHAQSWQPPTDNQRCPSPWGAGDQRGSGNTIGPDTVCRCIRSCW